ncbi:MAG: hypothetical protein KC420_21520, partial [Myxococcales bacterium]|nr:hypothetical protein [Myxococcales bacterium]
ETMKPGSVVVDVAGITIAASREGRVLMRAHYEVRNERAAHLRITPPPGMKILGARVAGETALPARGPDGAWLIPLKRSIETVKGALSFAVEVTLLGDGDPSKRREQRELPLPRVSAPVAVTRLTLHLPPGYTSRLDPGDGDVVDGFTRGEGITYGMAIGEVGVAEADERFQSAVGRWLANDFEGAQAELDALRNMGASNENIERLQANLDVIGGKQGGGSSGGDAAAERRIREQAKARASADIQAQSDLKSKAEAYQQAGEYDKAEAEYEKAMEIGDRLALLEQEESVEQQRANEDLARQYKSVKETKARRASSFGRKAEPKKKRGKKDVYASAGEAEWDVDAAVELPAGGEGDASIGGFAKTPAADPTGNVIYRDKSADGVGTESGGGGGGGAGTVLYDFEDDDVEGELLRPDGADLSSRGRNRASGL